MLAASWRMASTALWAPGVLGSWGSIRVFGHSQIWRHFDSLRETRTPDVVLADVARPFVNARMRAFDTTNDGPAPRSHPCSA